MINAAPIRSPFLIGALIISWLIVGVETGTSAGSFTDALSGLKANGAALKDAVFHKGDSKKSPESISSMGDLEKTMSKNPVETRSLSIAALSCLDILIVITLLLFTLPLFLDQGLTGKIQGPVFLLTAIFMVLGALVVIIKALASLILMVVLLLTIPFGTIIYMVLYASFNLSAPTVLLHSLFVLKILCFAGVVIASEFFLMNIGLLLLFGCSIGVQIVINFLYHFPPRFIVSITDAIGALIVAIVALIWAIVMAIAGIVAIAKALKASAQKVCP